MLPYTIHNCLVMRKIGALREYVIASKQESQPPKELYGGTTMIQISCQGSQRSAIQFKPLTAHGNQSATAVLVIFHGTSSSAKQMREVVTGYKYDLEAQKRGWITVYPDSDGMDWDDCRVGSKTASREAKRDDVVFYQSILRYCIQHHHIHPSMVYVGGWSNGAAMAIRLAQVKHTNTNLAPKAIFLHNAHYPSEENLLHRENESYPTIPTLIMSGMKDPTSPFHGGLVETKLFGMTVSRGRCMSFSDSLKVFVRGLTSRNIKLNESKHVHGSHTTILYQDSHARTLVAGIAFKNSGHYIPIGDLSWTPRTYIFGPVENSANGPSMVCNWLDQLPKTSSIRSHKL